MFIAPAIKFIHIFDQCYTIHSQSQNALTHFQISHTTHIYWPQSHKSYTQPHSPVSHTYTRCWYTYLPHFKHIVIHVMHIHQHTFYTYMPHSHIVHIHHTEPTLAHPDELQPHDSLPGHSGRSRWRHQQSQNLCEEKHGPVHSGFLNLTLLTVHFWPTTQLSKYLKVPLNITGHFDHWWILQAIHCLLHIPTFTQI